MSAPRLKKKGKSGGALQLMGYEGFLGSIQIAVVGLPLAYFLPGSDVGSSLPCPPPATPPFSPRFCSLIWF